FGAINVEPEGAEWYRSQVTADDFKLVATGPPTAIGQPTIPTAPLKGYSALYSFGFHAAHPTQREDCTPVLKMLDVEYEVVNGKCEPKKGSKLVIYHTDLTAIITGPRAGRFPGTTGAGANARPEPWCNAASEKSPTFDPLFCRNPASPD